jgi:hypothetical protein
MIPKEKAGRSLAVRGYGDIREVMTKPTPGTYEKYT